MNNNISISVKCGICGEETNLNEEVTLEESDRFGFLTIDFSDGTISFICKYCQKFNVIQLNANSRVNKGRRLPRSIGL